MGAEIIEYNFFHKKCKNIKIYIIYKYVYKI